MSIQEQRILEEGTLSRQQYEHGKELKLTLALGNLFLFLQYLGVILVDTMEFGLWGKMFDWVKVLSEVITVDGISASRIVYGLLFFSLCLFFYILIYLTNSTLPQLNERRRKYKRARFGTIECRQCSILAIVSVLLLVAAIVFTVFENQDVSLLSVVSEAFLLLLIIYFLRLKQILTILEFIRILETLLQLCYVPLTSLLAFFYLQSVAVPYENTNSSTLENTNSPTFQNTNSPTFENTNASTFQNTNSPTFESTISRTNDFDDTLYFCSIGVLVCSILLAYLFMRDVLSVAFYQPTIENEKVFYVLHTIGSCLLFVMTIPFPFAWCSCNLGREDYPESIIRNVQPEGIKSTAGAHYLVIILNIEKILFTLSGSLLGSADFYRSSAFDDYSQELKDALPMYAFLVILGCTVPYLLYVKPFEKPFENKLQIVPRLFHMLLILIICLRQWLEVVLQVLLFGLVSLPMVIYWGWSLFYLKTVFYNKWKVVHQRFEQMGAEFRLHDREQNLKKISNAQEMLSFAKENIISEDDWRNMMTFQRMLYICCKPLINSEEPEEFLEGHYKVSEYNEEVILFGESVLTDLVSIDLTPHSEKLVPILEKENILQRLNSLETVIFGDHSKEDELRQTFVLLQSLTLREVTISLPCASGSYRGRKNSKALSKIFYEFISTTKSVNNLVLIVEEPSAKKFLTLLFPEEFEIHKYALNRDRFVFNGRVVISTSFSQNNRLLHIAIDILAWNEYSELKHSSTPS